jgi:xylan 1,4-beta-xylosidase
MRSIAAGWVALWSVFLGASLNAVDDDAWRARIDFTDAQGTFRALHGVNKGPLGPGGLIDVIREHRALGIPLVRLHDCYWPNPYVVDIHAVFPDFNADPRRPESYDFRLTDEYIAAARATGAGIVYRLGESIEHTTVKRFARAPADYDQWAEICLGVIRHYNEGWADGFHHGIRYWEIWNEPENRPAMWNGSDEDYFRLYSVAAKAIRRAFPEVKIGGPGVGASGAFEGGVFRPSEFVTGFLKVCRAESLPLDFFSWHCYTADSTELAARARAIRALLDAHGFEATESHLNEWNFLPGNSWAPMSRSAAALERQRYYRAMAGAPGAAFIAGALIDLQDAPLDQANLFHGELGAFGLFDEFGVPQKNYYALMAFRHLLATPLRVKTEGGVPGRVALAGGMNSNRTVAQALVSNLDPPRAEFSIECDNLPWSGDTLVETRVIDANRDFLAEPIQVFPAGTPVVNLRLPAPAVALLTLREANASANSRMVVLQPANRLVFQRDRSGKAVIPLRGWTKFPGARIEARWVQEEDAEAWEVVTAAEADGTFQGQLKGRAGWHALEVRARIADAIVATNRVERVGVGEVFIVAGHSVAQGGDVNLPGADDERVMAIAMDPDLRPFYERTGDPAFLPRLEGHPFHSDIKPAPFGHGTYFWARFGELIARRENVPVLILNAAFGGTSLEHWAKSARGEDFAHGFVRSAIGMPYVNLRNALSRYASVTGVRAVLSDHGQNDAGQEDADVVLENYRAWVEQARRDSGHPTLAVVVNRQTPYSDRVAIREAQERMIRETPHCFPGPDYDHLTAEDRPDRIHLSPSGAEKAARMWADALDSRFFQRSVPSLPRITPPPRAADLRGE